MEQWEAYFGQLAAAGCDDGVRLSTAEMALLAVHGAYSSRLEEVPATHLPHTYSADHFLPPVHHTRPVRRALLLTAVTL